MQPPRGGVTVRMAEEALTLETLSEGAWPASGGGGEGATGLRAGGGGARKVAAVRVERWGKACAAAEQLQRNSRAGTCMVQAQPRGAPSPGAEARGGEHPLLQRRAVGGRQEERGGAAGGRGGQVAGAPVSAPGVADGESAVAHGVESPERGGAGLGARMDVGAGVGAGGGLLRHQFATAQGLRRAGGHLGGEGRQVVAGGVNARHAHGEGGPRVGGGGGAQAGAHALAARLALGARLAGAVVEAQELVCGAMGRGGEAKSAGSAVVWGVCL